MEQAAFKQFLSDLTELSRKHGIWVRASLPTTRPVLYPAYGSEKGYALISMDESDITETYLFDRIL